MGNKYFPLASLKPFASFGVGLDMVYCIAQILNKFRKILAPLAVQFAIGVGEVYEQQMFMSKLLTPVDPLPDLGIIRPALQENYQLGGFYVPLLQVLEQLWHLRYYYDMTQNNIGFHTTYFVLLRQKLYGYLINAKLQLMSFFKEFINFCFEIYFSIIQLYSKTFKKGKQGHSINKDQNNNSIIIHMQLLYFIAHKQRPLQFYMQNPKQQQKDRKLLQQLYSRLNITWQQKPASTSNPMSKSNPNPILHKNESNLISKSIAHKFYNSKKYKLSQWKPPAPHPEKKESAHVFTNTGIMHTHTKNKDYNHARKFSQPSIPMPLKQNINKKFEKYPACSLTLYSSKIKFKMQTQPSVSISPSIDHDSIQNQTCNLNLSSSKEQLMAKQKQKNTTKCRSFRAVSAKFSSRQGRSGLGKYCISGVNGTGGIRKWEENWTMRGNRGDASPHGNRAWTNQEKYDVKGWESQDIGEFVDIHSVDLKVMKY